MAEPRVRIRPIVPGDEPALRALFDRLSPETVRQRFFRYWRRLPDDWFHHFANVDYVERLALVAEVDGPEGPRVVGVARYEPGEQEGRAEVAVVVEDAWQGRGIGRRLLTELLAEAQARGIRRFHADVLADNQRMLALIRQVGEVESVRVEFGVAEIDFRPREAAPAGRE
ncbi:MAG TPA: GNAT family N-acetyltransferase [Calidithermus sp.]|nr:GNAT family N-acetyltransferase [Calidithermus sp.]